MIRPGSFDPETARAMLGDPIARVVEDKARRDAEAGGYMPPAPTGGSYWDQRRSDFELIVYAAQFQRRAARLAVPS